MGLKERIIEANKAYRTGNEIMSDAEYDMLLSELKDTMDWFSYQDFITSLMDIKGDVTLDYVLGSLTKYKYEEPEDFYKWISKNKITSMFASEKIDGCSFAASYRDGELVLCTSKGDSNEGTDWTSKAKFILPTTIAHDGILDIRGEFTLTHDSHEILGYKSRRAGTVGIMGEKSDNPSKLQYVKAIAYQILSDDNMIILNQFVALEDMGFAIPQCQCLYEIDNDIIERLKNCYNVWKDNSPYDIDGLVISAPEWVNENKFYPSSKIAFKVNSEGVPTKVEGITWELSKTRYMKPVLNITPIDINGATISNVTGYNAKWVFDQGTGIGAEVLVIKSGEVIPKIVGVTTIATPELPTHCPECSDVLIWNGVELQCANLRCAEVKRVEAFIKDIGIENVSIKRLVDWNINTFDQLLSWKPQSGKAQTDFYSELMKKVFNNDDESIMRAFSYDGIGSTNYDKLLAHFGDITTLNDVFHNIPKITNLPEGIGTRSLEKAQIDWETNYWILGKILSDERYKKPAEKVKNVIEQVGTAFEGKLVLFTGKFECVRNMAENMVREHGGRIAPSVSKALDILCCAPDSWGSSSKYKKAEKLGVKIITEKEFWEMIK